MGGCLSAAMASSGDGSRRREAHNHQEGSEPMGITLPAFTPLEDSLWLTLCCRALDNLVPEGNHRPALPLLMPHPLRQAREGAAALAGKRQPERAKVGRTDMLVTTTPGIEGRPVTEYLGVVTAQGVLGVNAFKDVGAGMRNIFGGRAKSYENELASGVSDALAEMEQQAAQLGADAVVGVDIDYETVGNNMLMVSVSGTAVRLG
jgi:uncharacterized protein YbjQ (UPF0145 family)